jgi:uncharacterized cupin superfamily protein
MWQINRSLSLIAFLAIALLILPQGVEAQEGIDAKDVAEWPVDNPGVEKVVLQRFEFAPGASMDFTMEAYEFCNGVQGEWTVTDHTTGVTTIYAPGSRWRMPPKGTKVTVANNGNVPAVQFVYMLVEKGM